MRGPLRYGIIQRTKNLKRLFASPFVHFILLGFGIFLLYGWLNRDANHPEGYDITITQDQQIQIAINHQRNFGEIPDPNTMDQLIQAEVQSEIYYREALRMGLDQNDEIIRRRLKQKYTFIQEDAFIDDKVTEEDLQNFYNENRHQYLTEPMYSFEHFYFNPDKRNNPEKDVLAFIKNPELKPDPFHIASPVVNQNTNELRNSFGFDFTQGIQEIDSLNTLYPIESGFGYHAIRVTNLVEARQQPFSSIRDLVMLDFQRNYRNERNKANYEKVKKKYNIQIEEIE